MFRRISMSMFLLLLIIGCSKYVAPSHSVPDINFVYESVPNSKLRSDVAIIIVPAIINTDYHFDFEFNDASKKLIEKNVDYQESIKKVKIALQNIYDVKKINRELGPAVSYNIKKILENKGFKEVYIAKSALKYLNYKECGKRKIVIRPVIHINHVIKSPLSYKSEILGRADKFEMSRVVRGTLLSDISASIKLEIFESLTEKLIGVMDYPDKSLVENKSIPFIFDGYYGYSGMRLLKFLETAYTDYGVKYFDFLETNFQKLLTPVDDYLSYEKIISYNDIAGSERSKYIPMKKKIEYKYTYTHPKKYEKLKNVYAVMLNIPGIATNDTIITKFENELNSQFEKLFKTRGVEILGIVKKIDDLVYMDKKKSYFAISFDKNINTNLQNYKSFSIGKIDVITRKLSINGVFGITIYETMTKQKLLQKRVNLQSSTSEIKIVNFVDKSNRFDKITPIYNNYQDKISYLLNESLVKVMDNLWQILSPKSMKEIKNNVNEIREKTGFPIIN